MTPEQREALAEYLTGPLVAHYSVCLQLGPPHTFAARNFFGLREVFGIGGYMKKEEALRKMLITQAHKPKREKA